MATTTANNVRKLRVPRRTPRACQQCRAGKVRCSGENPCTRCVRRRENCTFPSDEPHISVPESYLAELERQAAAAAATTSPSFQLQSPPGNVHSRPATAPTPRHHSFGSGDRQPAQVETGSRSTPPTKSALSPTISRIPDVETARAATVGAWTPRNPLIETQFLKDHTGRHRFLGPTSTWAFTRRLTFLLEQYEPQQEATLSPFFMDGAAFHLKWAAKPTVERSDLQGLPPKNYVDYMYSTVKFQLGDLFSMVDEQSFLQTWRAFQEDPWNTVQQHRLWFVEYLLFLAFGKAFLGESDGSNAPKGHEFAARAMCLLPGPFEMHQEELLGIEVLALVALYFQSIDMRIIAYQYIGQAVRLCGVEGIHHDMPDALVGRQKSARANLLWWNVYNLDRYFSALMGCSNSISDEQVSAEMPSAKDKSLYATALTLQISLSKLVAKTCTTVYHVSGEGLGGDYVKNTTIILHALAEVSQELEAVMPNFSKETPTDFPQVFSHVTLSYHHCIVLATRPLIAWLLLLALPPASTDLANLAPPIAALLQTSAESALSILAVLCKFAGNDLLETFLPFHLEFAFSATLLLSVLDAILPEHVPDRAWQRLAEGVLQKMQKKGNIVVPLRMAELQRLEELLNQHRRPPPPAADVAIPTGDGLDAGGIIIRPGDLTHAGGNSGLDGSIDFNTPSSWDVLFGAWPPTNSEQILGLADELDLGDFDAPMYFQN
ncbi:hypothetical protein AC579_6308 [Pseudocercospora musae]|uniref:Zn(2)-C6 fungal-type domain-containing protein n=1 Tax=Pseudocercospora musae TaxID=113226 RepID=A0A139IP55_9PEZI|nr:hypothetical protein AC579_6308 [Pseudocercospora musae]